MLNLKLKFSYIGINVMILSLMFIIFDLHIGKCHAQSCTLVTPCKCSFNNGTGIDLSTLDSTTLSTVPSSSNVRYIYHPCPTMTNTTCPDNAALCRVEQKGVTVLGTVAEATFGKNATDDTSYIQYAHPDKNGTQRATILILRCFDSPSSSQIEILTQTPEVLLLRSKASCITKIADIPDDEGLSTGGVLVIMFLIFGSLYFFGGMAILKFIRGATGVEIIPHYEFWSDLRLLVRDGIVFTLSGFQPSSLSYDRI